jgi:hydroxypyruvate reductase
VPDRTTFADALAVLAKYRIDPPAAVRGHLEKGAAGSIEETPKPGDPRLARVETIVVATPQRSLEAAASLARQRGLEVVVLGDNLEGEARELGALHARAAIKHSRHAGRPTVILSGGETTVTVRGTGRGGRNVEYLLGKSIETNGADLGPAADTDSRWRETSRAACSARFTGSRQSRPVTPRRCSTMTGTASSNAG